MTKSQALYVKFCRVRLECSWRIVQAMWVNRYYYKIPFDIRCQTDTNQQRGRMLCGQAQTLLDEDWESKLFLDNF